MTIALEWICGVCLGVGVDWIWEEEVIMIDVLVLRIMIFY